MVFIEQDHKEKELLLSGVAHLPTLNLELTRSINDFEIERLCLTCSGLSSEEAQKNMLFLLSVEGVKDRLSYKKKG